jgi:hypothetical protein
VVKDKSVWVCTPKGGLIRVFYNFKKRFIKSYTLGGIPELRVWGWEIEKKPNGR